MEKHKLFVSGLCFDTTEETLQKIFSEHGALKSVRIVTARSGKSKVMHDSLFASDNLAALSWFYNRCYIVYDFMLYSICL